MEVFDAVAGLAARGKPRVIRLAYDPDFNLLAVIDFRFNVAEQRPAEADDLEEEPWLGGDDRVRGSKPWTGPVPAVLTFRGEYVWCVELAGPPGRRHIAALVNRQTGERIEP